MNTIKIDAAGQMDRPTHASPANHELRLWWSVIAGSLALGIFLQAVFAGAMLSGEDWASTAHSANAIILMAAALTAGLVAAVTLRRIPHGAKLGWTLLGLALVVFLQTAIGKMSAQGANLLWLHIPLGVALVGFAMQAVAGARRLGGE